MNKETKAAAFESYLEGVSKEDIKEAETIFKFYLRGVSKKDIRKGGQHFLLENEGGKRGLRVRVNGTGAFLSFMMGKALIDNPRLVEVFEKALLFAKTYRKIKGKTAREIEIEKLQKQLQKLQNLP